MKRRTSRDAPTAHKLFNFIPTSLQPRRWAHIKRSLNKMKTILPTLLVTFLSFVGPASAEVAKQLHMAVIDLDKATLEQAPWLNSSHFIVVRSTEDPAFRWIEKITGKKLDEELKKHPLLIYSGITDAEYFTSKPGDKTEILLNIGSLKNRDPFSRGLAVSVAALPKGEYSVFMLQKVSEDLGRLGGGSGSGFGSGSKPSSQ